MGWPLWWLTILTTSVTNKSLSSWAHVWEFSWQDLKLRWPPWIWATPSAGSLHKRTWKRKKKAFGFCLLALTLSSLSSCCWSINLLVLEFWDSNVDSRPAKMSSLMDWTTADHCSSVSQETGIAKTGWVTAYTYPNTSEYRGRQVGAHAHIHTHTDTQTHTHTLYQFCFSRES